MVRVLIAPAARDWILGRAKYLAHHSPVAAARFRTSMRHAIEQLVHHPYSGPPGLIPDSRRLIVGDYVVSYRVVLQKSHPIRVEIFAVRHGRQNDALEPR